MNTLAAIPTASQFLLVVVMLVTAGFLMGWAWAGRRKEGPLRTFMDELQQEHPTRKITVTIRCVPFEPTSERGSDEQTSLD